MDVELAGFQCLADQFGTRHDPVAPVGRMTRGDRLTVR
jgi:hypothetical protein